MPIVTLQQTEITNPGGGNPIKLFGGNAQRVYFFLYGTCSVSSVLCLGPAGAPTTGFYPIGTLTDVVELRRVKYGELVTGEIWLSSFAGVAPNCDIIITEGILS